MGLSTFWQNNVWGCWVKAWALYQASHWEGTITLHVWIKSWIVKRLWKVIKWFLYQHGLNMGKVERFEMASWAHAQTLSQKGEHITVYIITYNADYFWEKGFYFCLSSVKGWDLHINWPFHFSHCSPCSFYLICGHVNEFFQFGTMWDYLCSVLECILSV